MFYSVIIQFNKLLAGHQLVFSHKCRRTILAPLFFGYILFGPNLFFLQNIFGSKIWDSKPSELKILVARKSFKILKPKMFGPKFFQPQIFLKLKSFSVLLAPTFLGYILLGPNLFPFKIVLDPKFGTQNLLDSKDWWPIN